MPSEWGGVSLTNTVRKRKREREGGRNLSVERRTSSTGGGVEWRGVGIGVRSKMDWVGSWVNEHRLKTTRRFRRYRLERLTH